MPYLTPETPLKTLPVLMQIPDTLLPHVVGGLLDLASVENWEKFGALSPEEAAYICGGIIDSILEDKLIAILPNGGSAGQIMTLVNPVTGEFAWSDYHYTPPSEVKLLYEASAERPYTLYPAPSSKTAGLDYPLTCPIAYGIDSTSRAFERWTNQGESPAVIFQFSGPVRIWRAFMVGRQCTEIMGPPIYPTGAGIFYSDDGITWHDGAGAESIKLYNAAPYSWSADIWCYQEVTPHQYWYVAAYQNGLSGWTEINHVALHAVSEV